MGCQLAGQPMDGTGTPEQGITRSGRRSNVRRGAVTQTQHTRRSCVRANRIGEVLRKMFTLAVQWGWCEDNPAQRFYRRTETPRERFLSKEEIASLAAALDGAEDRRAADIIRMCMLTGARLGEVRQSRFDQFNLEQLSWSKPPAMTKQRQVHRVPISDETAAIVRQRCEAVHSRPSNTGIQSRGAGFLSGGIVGGIGESHIRY